AAELADQERRKCEEMVLKVTQWSREHIAGRRFDEANGLVTNALAHYPGNPALEVLRSEVMRALDQHLAQVRAEEARRVKEHRRAEEQRRIAEENRRAQEQIQAENARQLDGSAGF